MRISTDSATLDLSPGSSAELGVDVTNTGALIDGVSARLIGLPDGHVVSDPPVLPLFPESSGRLVLTLTLPSDFPAGRHPLSVEVQSRTTDMSSSYSDLDLVVPEKPALQLTAQPSRIRSRRHARFALQLVNVGNVALDVAMEAVDPGRVLSIRCSPPRMTIAAGATVEPLVLVRSRRMILGTELDHPITVTVTGDPVGAGEPAASSWTVQRTAPAALPASPTLPAVPTAPGQWPAEMPDVDAPAAEPDTDKEPPAAATATLTLRQRPYLTRGLLTALILLSIIALWAFAFLLGISQVFGGDPFTKTAPASFYASHPVAGVSANATPETGDDPAPAGALPKQGALPAGVGGSVAGIVTAASNGEPVGRILVEARRLNRFDVWVAAGSAATQADGSFEIAGLFPDTFVLALSADGYVPSFAPASPDVAAAQQIPVTSGQVASGVAAVVTGLDATVNGKVDLGDTLTPTATTVTVRPVSGAGPGEPVATTTTDPAGNYQLTPLKAPFTYELSFVAIGYQTTTLRTTVEGGAQRYEPAVLLGTSPGTLTGVVTDGTSPLGDVTVTTTVDGQEVTTGTPTTGAVGSFVLSDLPTPATYVLTFSADGYATRTVVVGLGPGENLPVPTVQLVGGSGTVTGRLVDSAGTPVGGAIVTVGGTLNPPTTTTLTSGDVGSFTLTGLPSPGSYTITFTLNGYADTTVPVTLSTTSATPPLAVTMSSSLGGITGQVVTAAGAPAIGIAVTATDGVRVWPGTTTEASGSLPAGGYVIDQLPVGVYTVSATTNAGSTVTALVTVSAGATVSQDFTLPGTG